MLIECGFMRATDSDGSEYTFRPSLGRIASLGSPQEIVEIYAGLHGPRAAREAAYVLASLCDQDDPTPLVGCTVDGESIPGSMPDGEKVIIAQRLMHHGIIGKARPGNGGGAYSDSFHAAEYIAAARVHLGLSSADAEALSMTEFQQMFEMKFPDAGKPKRDVPTRAEYDAQMAAIMGKRRG